LQRDRRRLLYTAYELGFTHFDTARMYGDGLGERALAPLIRTERESLTIATKFGLHGWDWLGAVGSVSYPARKVRAALAWRGVVQWPKRDYSTAAMLRSADTSLRLLGTDHVDILFLHEPPAADFTLDEALREALLRLRSAGKTRYLGIAGDNAPAVFARHRDVFDVLQAPESVLDVADSVTPDLTYGVMRAVMARDLADGETRPFAALRRAFARQPAGSIVIGTTSLTHLSDYASAACLLAAGR
jgi:aryl-alcohol dehydrogenase-like predicted oxidoreductase